ncbi:hypothetical protein KL919_004012 [Ogataea angusta]|uniref:Uncharacterized protein n=1 Tax=Pichia angusta TaxID=870730 RepID=A0AAN6DD72_PICAN|nr:uncharacterized protein KL928_004180 [Ogataea angusta]KAG7816716.1 hypothetical protein KL928_004180 [Ogataea angusta]KAG7856482.1 hypothetical protein KL919_004012 [Ogataea angusta]
MGQLGSGKSTLVLQYVQSQFVEDIDANVQDMYKKEVAIDGQHYQLNILDIVDTDYGLDPKTENMLRESQAILIVYSVVSETSFDSVLMRVVHVRSLLEGRNVPIILVGAKADLENCRQVSSSSGLQLARELGLAAFLECSAKTKYQIDEVFETAVRQALTEEVEPTRSTEADSQRDTEQPTESGVPEDIEGQRESGTQTEPLNAVQGANRAPRPAARASSSNRCCIII